MRKGPSSGTILWSGVIERRDARNLPYDGDRLAPRGRNSWLRVPGFPISPGILAHPDGFGQIYVPPAPLSAVFPESIGEGSVRVSGDGQGEFYRAGIFRLFRILDCTGTRAPPPVHSDEGPVSTGPGNVREDHAGRKEPNGLLAMLTPR